MLQEDASTLEHEPEAGSAVADYLEESLRNVAGYDKKTATRCAKSLLDAGDLEFASAEVLESLYCLSMAHPRVGERLGLDPAELARLWAGLLERQGQDDLAVEALRRVADLDPENRALERELAGAMRRAGRVQEIVDRYMDRAEEMLRKGRTMEAIPWLQEVLLVDRSRRDVARLIRDLRYKDVEDAASSKRRLRAFVAVFLSAALLTVAGMREVELLRAYRSIPAAADGDLPSMRSRLASLESFASESVAWHRYFSVQREISELRGEVRTLEDKAAEEAARTAAERAEQLANAQEYRAAGLGRAEIGELVEGIRFLRMALETGGPDWELREEVEQDIKDIEDLLEGAE